MKKNNTTTKNANMISVKQTSDKEFNQMFGDLEVRINESFGSIDALQEAVEQAESCLQAAQRAAEADFIAHQDEIQAALAQEDAEREAAINHFHAHQDEIQAALAQEDAEWEVAKNHFHAHHDEIVAELEREEAR